MDLLLQPVVELYRTALTPVAPFTWVGVPLSALDVAAAFRLCVVMRQLKEAARAEHDAKRVRVRRALKGKEKARDAGVWDADGDDDEAVAPAEARSFVRDAASTLLVVYGGEIMSAPLLGIPPSFMLSGSVPVFYTLMQALVERLPVVPAMSLGTELPISLFDGLSRAYLLCNLIPPAVVTHTSPAVSTSPWTLLLTSFLTANGGFFLTGMFSFLAPTRLALATPPELLPYGWTTTDLWCAPLVTGLFALLTHAQPFWAQLHLLLATLLAPASVLPAGGAEKQPGASVEPVDAEVARAACAVLLASMFAVRAGKNFGALRQWRRWKQGPGEKIKVQ